MKKIVIHRPGGYERLCVEEHPDPEPTDGEVLLEVQCIGVNYADCVTRMGLYASAKEYVGYPITPGFEVAGTVAAVGGGVSHLTAGQRVIGVTRFGAYASHIALPQEQVFALPSTLQMADAAGLATAFLTAWYAIHELAHPHPGDHLLVHSAAGGVGSALVQLGKLAGCQVVGVVGASHKTDAVRRLGADAVIDKSSCNLWEEVARLSPAGYEVIFDANGGTSLEHSFEHLARPGKLVVYGFHGMLPKGRGRPSWPSLLWHYWRTPRFNPLQLSAQNRSVMAFNLSYLFDKADLLRDAIKLLLGWAAEGRIRTAETTAYPLEHADQAHRALESGTTVGKLVLVTDSYQG